MRLRTFTQLAVLSSVALAATVAMATRSYWRLDRYLIQGESREVGVTSQQGTVWLSTSTLAPAAAAGSPFDDSGFAEDAGYQSMAAGDLELRRLVGPGWLGFGHGYQADASGTLRLVAVPYWAFSLALSIVPAIWLFRQRRTRDPAEVDSARP